MTTIRVKSEETSDKLCNCWDLNDCKNKRRCNQESCLVAYNVVVRVINIKLGFILLSLSHFPFFILDLGKGCDVMLCVMEA